MAGRCGEDRRHQSCSTRGAIQAQHYNSVNADSAPVGLLGGSPARGLVVAKALGHGGDPGLALEEEVGDILFELSGSAGSWRGVCRWRDSNYRLLFIS